MAEYALIFTREAGTRHRVLGLLSSAFSESAGAKQTKLPLCSWRAEGGPEAILTEAKTEAAPLDRESRAASLRWMLACNGCPFADAAALLNEFAAFDVGTRLVMWGIKKDIHLRKHAPTPPQAQPHPTVTLTITLSLTCALALTLPSTFRSPSPAPPPHPRPHSPRRLARDVIVDAPVDAPMHRRSLHAFLEVLSLQSS